MRPMRLLCRKQKVCERKREQREDFVDVGGATSARRPRRDGDRSAGHTKGRWRAPRGRRTIVGEGNANGMEDTLAHAVKCGHDGI